MVRGLGYAYNVKGQLRAQLAKKLPVMGSVRLFPTLPRGERDSVIPSAQIFASTRLDRRQ